MNIAVNVHLGADDTLLYAPDAAAMQVLVALGGDASKDYCTVVVMTSGEPGTAGTPPAPNLPPP
jgi:hypothetical protein